MVTLNDLRGENSREILAGLLEIQGRRELKKFFEDMPEVTFNPFVERGLAGRILNKIAANPFGVITERTVNRWLDGSTPISRDRAYQLCIAFNLGLEYSETLFRDYLGIEFVRFNDWREVIYYYCLQKTYDLNKTHKIYYQCKDLLINLVEKSIITAMALIGNSIEIPISKKATEKEAQTKAATEKVNDMLMNAEIVEISVDVIWDENEQRFDMIIMDNLGLDECAKTVTDITITTLEQKASQKTKYANSVTILTSVIKEAYKNENFEHENKNDKKFIDYIAMNGKNFHRIRSTRRRILREDILSKIDKKYVAGILTGAFYEADDTIGSDEYFSDKLNKIADRAINFSREFFILCLLISGTNDYKEIDDILTMEYIGWTELDPNNFFDACVIEACKKSDNSKLSACIRFFETMQELQYTRPITFAIES